MVPVDLKQSVTLTECRIIRKLSDNVRSEIQEHPSEVYHEYCTWSA